MLFIRNTHSNGDAWYDGQDAIIVDCLENGLLTKEDVGEEFYTVAHCNHDGVIDQLDVALLTNVDQSKPTAELIEISSEYAEYLALIDQTPKSGAEDSTQQGTELSFIDLVMNFIRSIIEMIFARIPVPYKKAQQLKKEQKGRIFLLLIFMNSVCRTDNNSHIGCLRFVTEVICAECG